MSRATSAQRVSRLGSAAAVTGVVQFVAAWAVLGAIRDGYDPSSQAISELAEVGSPTRTAMTTSLILFGLLVAAFVPTLLRALRGGVPAATAVLLNAVGSIGAGTFPCSPGCPGPATSLSDLGHILAAFLSYLGLILAPLATAWRLRRVAARPALRRVSFVIGLLTLASVLAWVGGVASPAGGALQRVATTAGDTWYIVIAIVILRSDGKLV